MASLRRRMSIASSGEGDGFLHLAATSEEHRTDRAPECLGVDIVLDRHLAHRHRQLIGLVKTIERVEHARKKPIHRWQQVRARPWP